MGQKLTKTKPPKIILLVIQQGGSSTEFYPHTFDTVRDANAYRRSADKASYNTSEPIMIPENFDINVLSQIITAIVDMR